MTVTYSDYLSFIRQKKKNFFKEISMRLKIEDISLHRKKTKMERYVCKRLAKK